MKKENSSNGLQSELLVPFIILGMIISIIIGFIISFEISNSCAYHEPINKVPGMVFGGLFELQSGHPEASGLYWILIILSGLPIGLIIRKLSNVIRVKKENKKEKTISNRT